MTYKPDIMIYHSHCADGFGAAWAAWKRWGDEVDYIPCGYGAPPPYVVGKNVLIGDFSFKEPVLREMAAGARSIVVLDHHVSAHQDLQAFTTFLRPAASESRLLLNDVETWLGRLGAAGGHSLVADFDMTRSGARMVWDFCHPDQEAPWLIRYIEDRDLWRFQYEETKPFGLWLRSEPFSFDLWDQIARELDHPEGSSSILAEAKAMQRMFDRQVDEIAAMHRWANIGGYHVPVCNCPPAFASEVGHKLLEKEAEAEFVVLYSDQGRARGYSLRSTDNRADVSEIARKFGGGGHRNAAGFGVPLP